MPLPPDYHMHTPLCRHASGEPVDYARRALEVGLSEIGFSDHSPMRQDDFDDWLPRDQWRKAEHVLWVTDNRFPGDGAEQLPAHVRSSQARVRVMRGGRTSRIFELYLYERRAQGSL